MKEKNLKCVSCHRSLASAYPGVIFTCPSCGKVEIVRCNHCREIGAKYKCKSCNFEGPN